MRRFGNIVLVVHSTLSAVGQELRLPEHTKHSDEGQQALKSHGCATDAFRAIRVIAIRVHHVGTQKIGSDCNCQDSKPKQVAGFLLVAPQFWFGSDTRQVAMARMLRSSLGKGSIE